MSLPRQPRIPAFTSCDFDFARRSTRNFAEARSHLVPSFVYSVLRSRDCNQMSRILKLPEVSRIEQRGTLLKVIDPFSASTVSIDLTISVLSSRACCDAFPDPL